MKVTDKLYDLAMRLAKFAVPPKQLLEQLEDAIDDAIDDPQPLLAFPIFVTNLIHERIEQLIVQVSRSKKKEGAIELIVLMQFCIDHRILLTLGKYKVSVPKLLDKLPEEVYELGKQIFLIQDEDYVWAY